MGQVAAGPTWLCGAVPSSVSRLCVPAVCVPAVCPGCVCPGRRAPAALRPAVCAAGRARGYNAAAPGFPAPGPGRPSANPRRGEGWARPSLAAGAASLRGNHAVVAPAARGARLPRRQRRPAPPALPPPRDPAPARAGAALAAGSRACPGLWPAGGSGPCPAEISCPCPTEISGPCPMEGPGPRPPRIQPPPRRDILFPSHGGICSPIQEEAVGSQSNSCTLWCA